MASSSSIVTPTLPRSRSLAVTVDARDPGGLIRGLFRKPPRSTLVGLAALGVVLLVCLLGIDLPLLAAAQADGVYKFASGAFVLGYILLQWNLFAHREKDRQPALVAKWYRRHKMLGALAPLVFALHTTSFGHALLLTLSLTFLFVVLSGYFNRDLLNVQSQIFWRTWIVLHVGAGLALYALVALHVWTALSFHQ